MSGVAPFCWTGRVLSALPLQDMTSTFAHSLKPRGAVSLYRIVFVVWLFEEEFSLKS